MKSTVTFLLAAISFAALIACSSAVSEASPSASDAEVIEALAGTSWSGSYHEGQVTFAFHKDKKGRLAGNLVSGTSPYGSVATGALRWVEVKGGVLTFSTSSGFDYELRMSGDQLVGSLSRSNYRSQVALTK